MKIKEMDYSEKPRERAKKHGFQILTNVELVALIIRSGTKGKSALQLASEILNQVKSLTYLRSHSINDLNTSNGMGDAKSISLLAAVELSNRLSKSVVETTKTKVTSPNSVYQYMLNYKFNLHQEEFYVICLNARKEIISSKLLFVGTIETTIIHPRDIFKYAINNNATFVVFAHNHPTGNTSPSNEDIEVTSKLVSCGILMNVKVLDHIIYSLSECFSFREHDLIK